MLSDRIIGFRERFLTHNQGLLLLSIAVQLALALWFGRFYDVRIFMATGYLVGTVQNPHAAQDLTTVFNNILDSCTLTI